MLHNTGQSLVFRVDKESKIHVNISGGPLGEFSISLRLPSKGLKNVSCCGCVCVQLIDINLRRFTFTMERKTIKDQNIKFMVIRFREK